VCRGAHRENDLKRWECVSRRQKNGKCKTGRGIGRIGSHQRGGQVITVRGEKTWLGIPRAYTSPGRDREDRENQKKVGEMKKGGGALQEKFA